MNFDLDFSRVRMACLADASRFRIVLTLLEAELCVSELASRVGLSQSCTTRHLQALQGVGLVRGSRDGKRVMFRAEQGARDVFDLLGATLGVERAGQAGKPATRSSRPGRAARGAAASLEGNGVGNGGGDQDPIFDLATPGTTDGASQCRRAGAGPMVREDAQGDASTLEELPAPRAPRRSDLEDFLL